MIASGARLWRSEDRSATTFRTGELFLEGRDFDLVSRTEISAVCQRHTTVIRNDDHAHLWVWSAVFTL
jgi:hypothetical protein